MSENRWPDHYDDLTGQDQAMVDAMRALFPKLMQAKSRGECPFCGRDVQGQGEFRDELSWREFLITGTCQGCQDAFFGNEEA